MSAPSYNGVAMSMHTYAHAPAPPPPLSYSGLPFAAGIFRQGWRDDWGGKGIIAGSFTIDGNPAWRRIRLFDRKTGKVVRETWSDPETGEYAFEQIAVQNQYMVICDDYAQSLNGAIADWVTPDLMS